MLYFAPMKRWLVTVMLLILPMQAAWSAATDYCRDEQGAAALHFGHHEHKHRAPPDEESGKAPRGASAADPDCGVHKLGAEKLSSLPLQLATFDGTLPPAEAPRPRLPSVAPLRPERPNWRPLA